MTDYLSAKIEDELLTVVMKHSPFPPLETAQAFQKLGSFDRLLEAIGQARREKKSLYQVAGSLP